MAAVEIRDAVQKDLPATVEIYNSTVPLSRMLAGQGPNGRRLTGCNAEVLTGCRPKGG
jgi:hypothetical protein